MLRAFSTFKTVVLKLPSLANWHYILQQFQVLWAVLYLAVIAVLYLYHFALSALFSSSPFPMPVDQEWNWHDPVLVEHLVAFTDWAWGPLHFMLSLPQGILRCEDYQQSDWQKGSLNTRWRERRKLNWMTATVNDWLVNIIQTALGSGTDWIKY